MDKEENQEQAASPNKKATETPQERATADLRMLVNSYRFDAARISAAIAAGADVNVKRENNGLDILMLAMRDGTADDVKMILGAGANPFALTTNGRNALSRAVQYDNVGAVEILAPLSDTRASGRGLKFVNGETVEDKGSTPFQMALRKTSYKRHDGTVDPAQARQDNEKKAKMLAHLAPLSDVQTTDWDEMAVLAAVTGGAKLLQLCAAHCDLKSLKSSLCSEEPEPLLLAAVEEGACETVEILLNAGCDPDEKSHNGETALMRLATARRALTTPRGGKTEQERRLECLRILAAVADTEIQDSNGDTALMRSLFEDDRATKNDAAVKILAARSDLNAQDARGNTAFMRALEWSSIYSVLQVLAPKSDLKIKNAAGEDAFAVAMRCLDDGRLFLACDLMIAQMTPKDAMAASLQVAAHIMPSAKRKIEARELELEVERANGRMEGMRGPEGSASAVQSGTGVEKSRRTHRGL